MTLLAIILAIATVAAALYLVRGSAWEDGYRAGFVTASQEKYPQPTEGGWKPWEQGDPLPVQRPGTPLHEWSDADLETEIVALIRERHRRNKGGRNAGLSSV